MRQETPKIKLAAQPADGAANAELVAFLAKKLRLPKSAVKIVSGFSSRMKTMEIKTDMNKDDIINILKSGDSS